jgi:hypothetical protein
MYKDPKSYNRIARQLWEKEYGTRPIDEVGRVYEVHHIDRDVTNNNLENLICVSKNTHLVIHLGYQEPNEYLSESDVDHIRAGTVLECIDFDSLDELVDALYQVTLDAGVELTEESGHREGWNDMVIYPDEEMSTEEEDVFWQDAYEFIWTIAYPMALSRLISD